MMVKTDINQLSDDAVIARIGSFVRKHRLEQNLTQQELATMSGINRTTLRDLESGKRIQLITLIQVLRMLGQLQVFESFEYSEKLSPLKIAELESKKRKRASGKSSGSQQKSDW